MTTLRTLLPPRWRWPFRIALALSGWVALAATLALPDAGVPRLLIVCVFLLLCPGAAAVRWTGPAPRHHRGRPVVVETAFLAVVLSLCLSVLVLEPFYLSGSYTTTRVLITLAAVTSLLALLPAPGGRRPGTRRPVPDDTPSGPAPGPAPPTDIPGGPGATAPGNRPGGSRHPHRPSGRVAVVAPGPAPPTDIPGGPGATAPGNRPGGSRHPHRPSGRVAVVGPGPAPPTDIPGGPGATAPGNRPGGSRHPHRPSGRVAVAVVGAGPYGLATACHLSAAGVRPRVFGQPMESWRAHMPDGMLLQTGPAASAIAAPGRGHAFTDFRAARGLPRPDDHHPVLLAEYVDYGRWFQERLVPELEPCRVRRIRAADGGFRLLLDSGEEPLTAAVVLATGAVPFAYVPRELHACAEEGLASHSSEHADLRHFAGERVAVVGAGQSALECATLLHETGARPTVIARTPAVVYDPPPPNGTGNRPHRSRLPGTDSPLGRGRPLLAAVSRGGAAYRRLPAPLRMELLRTLPRPSGAWWLKERADGRFPVLCGRTLVAAEPGYGVVRLRLVDEHGWPEDIVADHVLAATGYRVDLRRLDVLEPGLRRSLRVFAGAPVLTTGFQSSTPGLYFTGLAAAPSFGPLLRFVAGTAFAARRLTAAVVTGNRR